MLSRLDESNLLDDPLVRSFATTTRAATTSSDWPKKAGAEAGLGL
jgi:hypothetical protein